MLLATLFTIIPLLARSPSLTTDVETLKECHIETKVGKADFTDKLSSFLTSADELNQEVESLALEIKRLSSRDDQQEILDLTEKLTQKMDKLLQYLPTLELAQWIDDDLSQIESILQHIDELTTEQEEILHRVAAVCKALQLD